MERCKECGKPITDRVYGDGLCQGCYKYFKNGGAVYDLPKPGYMEYDDDGKPICHICGRSFKRLGSHVRESHSMSISEYKERFGLCANCRTTEANYRERMRQHNINNNMPELIKKVGEATRVKHGENHMRKGKEIRLQEKILRRKKFNKTID